MHYITETQPRFGRMLEKWITSTKIPLNCCWYCRYYCYVASYSSYSELLNSVHDTSSKSFVCEHVDAVLPDSRILVSSCDVSDSLKKIKLGKSAGIDGLAAEHFVYSHEHISVHLAMLFTSILTHGYLPDL